MLDKNYFCEKSQKNITITQSTIGRGTHSIKLTQCNYVYCPNHFECLYGEQTPGNIGSLRPSLRDI